MADDKQSNEKQSESTGAAAKPAPAKESNKQSEKKPVEPAGKSGDEKQASGSTVETEGSLKETPAPAVKAAVVAAAPAPAPTPEPAAAAPTLQVNDADASVLEMFNHRVDEYIAAMKVGKPVDGPTGGQWQKKLFAIIDQILKLEGTVFFKAWSNLLAKVNENRKGVFSEAHAFRFTNQMKLDAAELRRFQLLIHLIIHTADPKGRQQMLKMIEITRVTETLRIPGASDRLYAYYKL